MAKCSAAFWLGFCVTFCRVKLIEITVLFLAVVFRTNLEVTVFLHIRFDVIIEQMAVTLGVLMLLQDQQLLDGWKHGYQK